MGEKNNFGKALQDFQKYTKAESFISGDNAHKEGIKCLLKHGYDFTKSEETRKLKSDALPELIVNNFDLEQIWQQLELQNDKLLHVSIKSVSKLVVGKNKLIFNEIKEDETTIDEKNIAEEKEDSENDDSSEDDDDRPLNLDPDESDLSMDSEGLADEEETVKKVKPGKISAVDDQFFKLSEMEAFLENEEKKLNDAEPDSGNDSEEENMDDDEVDDEYFYNDDIESKDKERGEKLNPKYKDFFCEDEDSGSKKKAKRNKFFEELENDGVENKEGDDDEEDDDELMKEPVAPAKSAYELRAERLKRKIGYLEEAAVGEKPWQLKGEITAESRPQNSLLEEVVDFDLLTRPAPIITEQTSLQLEDVIKQRIKDKVFDSVVRKEKPVETALEYKKKLVLNQEKSKESLAQIYENEFIQQREAQNTEEKEVEEEEPELHKNIRKKMDTLFSKLDALSNFYFTPKPAVPELKIVSNVPAIEMEEVAPVATSDATLLAPEEVKRKSKGDAIGKSERTETDKNRERRNKKLKQKHHAILNEKKAAAVNKLGLGNKYSKEKAKKMLEQVTKHNNVDKMDESVGSKSVKSSTAFFTQLQEEVKSQIKSKVKENKSKDNVLDAKKFKL
ncbi:PREDICTED: U3 small nucleolar ribonucleoprotein protein MPP10 [Nicrophorus vespilloides]|uniref:U3 small nucleolar ribonucleoprotein protein MPP10 n=1 Tax=Nicrophorus vespilloides TaxID=110193 RepID=A0ABM1MWF9_NICVS|nr:PREDICTED: U3 small nucleolar ribonucleoprotein protein MPP10 [Nicrophorus vespilloides]